MLFNIMNDETLNQTKMQHCDVRHIALHYEIQRSKFGTYLATIFLLYLPYLFQNQI